MLYAQAPEPVTLYASVLQSPYATSRIDQIAIRELQEPTIEPLLNRTAGIWMQTGALNTNRISIRGVGYNEPFATSGIKVYLDEIPLTNGVGEASIEDIHPLTLSGIDIWRGPASALWGSGLGGMIHLKSDIPLTSQWQSRLQAGSFGRFQSDQHLSMRYGRENEWGTAVHYQYLNDDGYRRNNAYDKHSLTWMQQYNNSKGLTLHSFLHHIDLKAFIPSSISATALQQDPSSAAPAWAAVRGREDYTRWITGLSMMYAPSAGWVYRGAVFGTFFDSDEVRPFNVLQEGNDNYGMRHRITFPVKQHGHVTAGMEYFKERYRFTTFETLDGGQAGMMLTDGQENRAYWNAFIQSDWRFSPRWYIFSGINVAAAHVENISLASPIPADIFPTLGINFGETGQIELSASISRGYSALGLEGMLDSQGLINPDIVPETGWSYEVAIKRDNGLRGFTRVTAYLMQIQNTILTVNGEAPDTFEKVNGGRTLHRGLELETMTSNARQTLTLEAQMTWSWPTFKKFEDIGGDKSGNTLPGIPELRQNLRLVALPWPRWSASMEMHVLTDLFLNNANTLKSDGYFIINAGLRYEAIRTEKWDCTLSAWAHNVTDESYSSMFQINATGSDPRYYYPGKPRSFYFTLALNHRL